MTNQAAQTMPERTYMTRDEALKIARACAYAKCHTHGYLPRTAKEAADWQPHEWVLDAIRWNAILQPVMVSEAGVPEGWVLVPARMELTPENMAALAFMLGGDPDAKDADERWNGGTLWIGETIGDHGEKYYGLNVANVECYEEGSMPIVEFATPPAPQRHPDALEDGSLSKSTAKRQTGEDDLEARARAMFEAQADPLAASWDRQWGPTKEYWRKVARGNLYATTHQPSADAVREVPDGMVLVPREPDISVVHAMREAYRSVRRGGIGGQTLEASFQREYAPELVAYYAMLSAASGEKGVG